LQDTSRKLLARASRVIPAGVNSPVRAWRAVGGDPPFVIRGRGAQIWDADGRSYLDLVNAWGPLIAGHAHPKVVSAVVESARRGTGFGAPTIVEVELAELVCDAFSSIEKVRLVTSGTEATMTALRLARAATGRERIVKFAGCYHGHVDPLLVRAGSGAATFGVPDSAGIPDSVSRLTSIVEYNDLEALRSCLAQDPPPAAVILEPVAANMGVVPPVQGFLQGVVELAHAVSALVIFDEVISGFRIARGGAQERYGVSADLTCLGKVIGGGMPVAAVGGRAELMDLLAPLGPVYQAGTLAGNPVACSAGVATIKLLGPEAYAALEARGAQLETGLREEIRAAGVAATVQRVGSLLTLFFTPVEVRDFRTALQTDTEAFARFFHAMVDRGVNLPPSQFEAWFLSLAHGEAEVEQIVTAARAALRA
jgi:glutamate-1-semialdehyde 2,1-aminomutase